MRGLPGSGKTTVSEILSTHDNIKYPVISADDYMIDESGNYLYDNSKIRYVHERCYERVKEEMINGTKRIFVCNVLIDERQKSPYIELAEEYSYSVFSMIVENNHNNVNVHGCNDDTIHKMKGRFTVKTLPNSIDKLIPYIPNFLTFDWLIENSPASIKERMDLLKYLSEREDFHPEENVYEHIRNVTESVEYTFDPDIILAAFFHDQWKLEVAYRIKENGISKKDKIEDINNILSSRNIKTYGHERLAEMNVKLYDKFITGVQGNTENVSWLVGNHMRIKQFDHMRECKRSKLTSNPLFNKLLILAEADKNIK